MAVPEPLRELGKEEPPPRAPAPEPAASSPRRRGGMDMGMAADGEACVMREGSEAMVA